MKVVHFKASSNSCALATIWWAKWCPGDLPRTAGRDAELGKVVGILKYAVKEGERAARSDRGRRLQEASPSAAAAAKVVRSRAREAMQPRKKYYGELNIGCP